MLSSTYKNFQVELPWHTPQQRKRYKIWFLRAVYMSRKSIQEVEFWCGTVPTILGHAPFTINATGSDWPNPMYCQIEEKKTISRNDCSFYCYKKKQCYGVALLLLHIYIWAWNLKGNPKKSISQCWPFWPQQGGLLYLLVLKIWFDWQYCCRIYNIQEKKTLSPILMYWIF